MMDRHYLFEMWEGGGNVPPMLGVAQRLIARGPTVTVLGDPTIQVEAERFGCRFMPWRRAPHRTTLRPEDDLLRDWETKNPFAMLRRYRDRFITARRPRPRVGGRSRRATVPGSCAPEESPDRTVGRPWRAAARCWGPALNQTRRDQTLQCEALLVLTSAAFDFSSPFVPAVG
jgi:hypothetical protein